VVKLNYFIVGDLNQTLPGLRDALRRCSSPVSPVPPER